MHEGTNMMRGKIGGRGRNRTDVHGFAGRCITTLPLSLRRASPRLPHYDSAQENVLIVKRWSGKRDSNSRPQPWQGCALPTELFPRYPVTGAYFSDPPCAVNRCFQ